MKLLLKAVPESGRNDLAYFIGKPYAILDLDKTPEPSDTYTFSLYNDQFWLLFSAKKGDKLVRQKANRFIVTVSKSTVWIPGHYFLLFRNGDTVHRFDLQLDEHGTFSQQSVTQCVLLSDEDILSGVLLEHGHWHYLSRTPGLMQWKRWLITRLQERKLNALRAENLHPVLAFCNNLLLASPSNDFFSRNVTLLKYLAEIKCEYESADCSKLYNPSKTNPYEKLDEVFSNQVNNDNILNMSLPVLEERQYCFSHIWALLEPGREYVLKKLISHCPSYYDSVFFCGTQEDIDRLLEREPSLQPYFPQRNRLAIEPYALMDIILLFFHEVEEARLQLSPEATDAACRLLTQRFEQGTIRNWTLTDVRHYIRGEILPAYNRRAIVAIQHGTSPTEVLEVLPEDLGYNNETD